MLPKRASYVRLWNHHNDVIYAKEQPMSSLTKKSLALASVLTLGAVSLTGCAVDEGKQAEGS